MDSIKYKFMKCCKYKSFGACYISEEQKTIKKLSNITKHFLNTIINILTENDILIASK